MPRMRSVGRYFSSRNAKTRGLGDNETTMSTESAIPGKKYYSKVTFEQFHCMGAMSSPYDSDVRRLPECQTKRGTSHTHL